MDITLCSRCFEYLAALLPSLRSRIIDITKETYECPRCREQRARSHRFTYLDLKESVLEISYCFKIWEEVEETYVTISPYYASALLIRLLEIRFFRDLCY